LYPTPIIHSTKGAQIHHPQTTNPVVPTTLEELNLYISREYGYLDEISHNSTWAIYSRVSRIDPKFHGYSLEIQPDRAEEYARAGVTPFQWLFRNFCA
jgi:hypothetical protein